MFRMEGFKRPNHVRVTKTTFFSQLSIFAKNVRCQDKGYDHLKFLPHELTMFIVCLTYLRDAICYLASISNLASTTYFNSRRH